MFEDNTTTNFSKIDSESDDYTSSENATKDDIERTDILTGYTRTTETIGEDIIAAERVVLESAFKQGQEADTQTVSSEGQMIIRRHFGTKIITALEKIQDYAETEGAAMHASRIIKNSRLLFEKSYSDPFVEIVMCLYDALRFDAGWAEYSAEQYKGAYLITLEACNDKNLTDKKITKAVNKLHELGFDIFPIGFD